MEKVISKKLKIRPATTIKAVIVYAIVLLISFIFAFPCIWLILSSFNANGSLLTLDGFFPKTYSFDTFKTLFTEKVEHDYMTWFGNTLFVAGISCVISTVLVLAVSYTMSRYRFNGRKQMMKATLLLSIFPNFMNMTALFVIMTQFDLINNLWGLILLYSSIYDAATLDGATDLRVFVSITLPLSKPMIVYTALTAFVWPWSDFMLPKLLLPDKSQWTVAIGLNWLDESKFSIFAAGSVFIAVPIVALYIALSKYLIQGGAAGAVKE